MKLTFQYTFSPQCMLDHWLGLYFIYYLSGRLDAIPG